MPPHPPPLPRSGSVQTFLVGKVEFCKGKSLLGHFWCISLCLRMSAIEPALEWTARPKRDKQTTGSTTDRLYCGESLQGVGGALGRSRSGGLGAHVILKE